MRALDQLTVQRAGLYSRESLMITPNGERT
jgi:hypothetical protein